MLAGVSQRDALRSGASESETPSPQIIHHPCQGGLSGRLITSAFKICAIALRTSQNEAAPLTRLHASLAHSHVEPGLKQTWELCDIFRMPCNATQHACYALVFYGERFSSLDSSHSRFPLGAYCTICGFGLGVSFLPVRGWIQR